MVSIWIIRVRGGGPALVLLGAGSGGSCAISGDVRSALLAFLQMVLSRGLCVSLSADSKTCF
jgi:hypothetical protein